MKEFLTTDQLAGLTNESTKTWSRRRLDGSGPPYLRTGRKVLYRRADVDDWLASRTFKHRAAEAVARSAA